jgi:tetratricopeptide (TPR) repeat protein
LLQETARAYRFNGQPDQALAFCRKALEMAERQGYIEVQAETLATLGILPNQSREEQNQALQRAVELAESAGLLSTASRAHLNLGVHLQERGQIRAALGHYIHARDLAQRAGLIAWEAGYERDIAETCMDLGDLAGAEAAIAALQRLQPALANADFAEVSIRALQALLMRYRGELEEAIEQAETSRAAFQPQWERRTLILIDAGLADVYLELQRWQPAEALLDEALRLNEQDAAGDRLVPLCMLSVAYAGQGRLDEARQALEAARQSRSAHRVRLNTGRVLWAEAHLAVAEGRPEAAEAALAALLELARELETRWLEARILHSWGEMTPDTAAGRDLLRQAHALYVQMGAIRYVEMVSARL